MPLSFGIPLGIMIMIAGAILFFVSPYKKAAKVILGVGAVITLLTLFLSVLVLNSQM